MGNNLKEAIEKAKELVFKGIDYKNTMQAISKINSFATLVSAFNILWLLLKQIAVAVEMVQKEYKMCSEAERIEVAAQLLDELVEFRGWLSIFEPFDGYMFKLLISAAVNALNDKYGHHWLDIFKK